MKRYFIFILIFSCALSAHSISSYKASYDLYGQTDLGNIKFGSAEYELVVGNNTYVFTSNASTDILWRAIHDYSRNGPYKTIYALLHPRPHTSNEIWVYWLNKYK